MVAKWAVAVALVVASAAYATDGLAAPSQNDTSTEPHMPVNGTITEITSQEDLRRVVAEAAARRPAPQPAPWFDPFPFNEDVQLLQTRSAEPYYGDPGDFSATNIQTAGVDEPDYIKNDGEYLYVMSGDNVLSVVDVWPPDQARVVLRTALDVDGRVDNMFLGGDRLVMFYTAQQERRFIPEFGFAPQTSHGDTTHALIVDIADKDNPRVVNDYTMEGRFLDARMIGNHAYFVTGSPINYGEPRLPVLWDEDGSIQTPRAFYFDDETSVLTDFVTLAAIDVQGDGAFSETFLMGETATFYVSTDNFYLAYQRDNPDLTDTTSRDRLEERFVQTILPLLPQEVRDVIFGVMDGPPDIPRYEWTDISVILQLYYGSLPPEELDALFDAMRDNQATYDEGVPPIPLTQTVIHRISIDGPLMRYEAKGEVPGNLHNQFSMDEYDSRLRVATTTDYESQDSTPRSNGVYTLDLSLDVVGALEGVAPGESIFSARFMGERLYLVTFQQVDPFFVIDLSGDAPQILGELKLPGFSDYLHPYGNDYVIGVGRDTDLQNGWARQLGVKIAVFDVRNVTAPAVLDDHIIGATTQTYSEALSDHKAFFLDGSRGLLAVPIAGPGDELGADTPPRQLWGGFYVFDLTGGGLDLKGTVEHSDGSPDQPQGFRTFYIGDTLYTVSSNYIKMNDMGTLEGINSLPLSRSGGFLQFLE